MLQEALVLHCQLQIEIVLFFVGKCRVCTLSHICQSISSCQSYFLLFLEQSCTIIICMIDQIFTMPQLIKKISLPLSIVVLDYHGPLQITSISSTVYNLNRSSTPQLFISTSNKNNRWLFNCTIYMRQIRENCYSLCKHHQNFHIKWELGPKTLNYGNPQLS